MHTIADETSAPKRAGRGRGRGWGGAFIIVLLLVAMARGVSGVAATHGSATARSLWQVPAAPLLTHNPASSCTGEHPCVPSRRTKCEIYERNGRG